MTNIDPCLWFDSDAEAAAKFYTSLFKNSKIFDITHYDEASAKASGRSPGSVLTVSFQLEGQKFLGLNGGPIFKFTPAISFYVSLATKAEVDELWQKLSPGGKVLMELDSYPFSDRFGWLEDKYGLSWQLILGKKSQPIIPMFMFVGNHAGQAEEAMNFYTNIFKNSKVTSLARYTATEDPPGGTIKHGEFILHNQEFMAMDSGLKHDFNFTEAISFVINCESQSEVDYYWEKLSAVPASEQCGWLKDKYGISWQVVPVELETMLADADKTKASRAMSAMLQMKKIDINIIRKEFNG